MARWRTSARLSHELAAEANDLRRSWRAACEGAGVCHRIDTVTGTNVRTPRVISMVAGNPVRFVVELLPGQLAADLAGVGHRLAPHLGGRSLRITSRGLTHVLVEVVVVDPLAGVVAPVAAAVSALDPLTLGIGDDGRPVELHLADAAHVIVQGSTGSGKSIGLYSLLGQLAEADDVVVTGCDPTGLLLGPWAGRRMPRGIPRAALGTRDPGLHVTVLELLVAEMDHRVENVLAGRDAVTLGLELPVAVVVLEEYPGLLRALDVADAKGLGRRARAAVARLLAEGRKAGVRVVLIAQRADAGVIGGFERGQASHRISYRVDSMDAVKMLHPDAAPGSVEGHPSALPGIALATVPGRPLLRLRSPLVSYSDYVAAVSGWSDGTTAVSA